MALHLHLVWAGQDQLFAAFWAEDQTLASWGRSSRVVTPAADQNQSKTSFIASGGFAGLTSHVCRILPSGLVASQTR